MDPKWHPTILMVLGATLLVFTYVTSLFFVENTLQASIAFTVMTVAVLTLASGVTLAFIHTFRKDPMRFRR